ncbi:hypothetical protein LNP24_17750 [Klebsiella pneumoniae subsp. pneumoniae]|nr:hypothetical protein [Klebsiella pneumoniae subsp. pneumoniae]
MAPARPARRRRSTLHVKGFVTGLMGERFGGQVLDTVDIENYISVPKTEGQKLAGALKAHVNDY